MPDVGAPGEFRIARPAVAAGVLFFDADGRVLVVEPSYKDGWDIPGGYVEPEESPWAAAAREVREELGIETERRALLAVDWAPNGDEGDKLLFVFDGGCVTPADIPPLPSDHAELRSWEFCDVAELSARLPPRLATRITTAIGNRSSRSQTYVEHGRFLDAVPSSALPPQRRGTTS